MGDVTYPRIESVQRYVRVLLGLQGTATTKAVSEVRPRHEGGDGPLLH